MDKASNLARGVDLDVKLFLNPLFPKIFSAYDGKTRYYDQFEYVGSRSISEGHTT